MFLNKKKKKRNNLVVKVAKVCQKMQKANWLSKEKKWERTFYHNYKKAFSIKRFYFFIRELIRNFFLSRLCLQSSLSTNKKYDKKYQKFLFPTEI